MISSSARNCHLFKQKGYLNCYVAQLFMPRHNNARVPLCRKVTYYDQRCFSPLSHSCPSSTSSSGVSLCMCAFPCAACVGHFTPRDGTRCQRGTQGDCGCTVLSDAATLLSVQSRAPGRDSVAPRRNSKGPLPQRRPPRLPKLKGPHQGKKVVFI